MKDRETNIYSYAGRILRVDLSTSTIRRESSLPYVEKWLGGRAVNTWILLNEMNPETSWNEPESLLCFGVGALVGTGAAGACRVSVECKNVFNGGLGSANVGGFWGAELKFAGLDHVVIRGKAARPVYLWIDNDIVELRDASSMWGCSTWDTERHIRNTHRDPRIRVAAIGPAGEKQVKSACIICDRAAAAGGSGCGAVMGSKNLKAIAVRGTGGIRIADPNGFMTAVDQEMLRINRWPHAQEIRTKGYYGALGGRRDSDSWNKGYRPVRNGQDDYWSKEKVAAISEDVIKNYRTGTVACFNCPIACKPWMKIETAPYKVQGEGWWNNSSNAFCTKIDSTDIEAAIYAHNLVNQLGLDLDNSAQVVAWAFECYEKGFLSEKETDGVKLEWGNSKAMLELLKKIAYRENLGDILAEGALQAAKKLGFGDDFVVHVKGQDSLDGVRINKGWGFGIVVSPVSGRHLRGSLSGFWMIEDYKTNSYENVPADIAYYQCYKGIQDIIGVCSYVYGQKIDDWVALFAAATGRNIQKKELLLAGRKAHNLEKAFNTIHAGFGREHDYPCTRFWNEAVQSGPYKGEMLHHDKWEQMLDEYYELNGWDRNSGMQTKEDLEKLGLNELAQLLSNYKKI